MIPKKRMTKELSLRERSIAISIVETGALKFGRFVLSTSPDGKPKVSPYYVDLRILRSFPRVLHEIARALQEIIAKENLVFDALADVPTGATPLTAVLSQMLRVPMVSPRKGPKPYGTMKQIDGIVKPGMRVALVEDVIVTGQSVMESVRILRSEGCVVDDVLSVLDREEGGYTNLLALQIKPHPILTRSQLFTVARELGIQIPRI